MAETIHLGFLFLQPLDQTSAQRRARPPAGGKNDDGRGETPKNGILLVADSIVLI